MHNEPISNIESVDSQLGCQLDKSYRLNNCCFNCVHSEITVHQDMTESYCNYHRDSPPCVDFRANDQNEDAIFEARRVWEVGHSVDLWGICDRYERLLNR